jgi:hypothetical protein
MTKHGVNVLHGLDASCDAPPQLTLHTLVLQKEFQTKLATQYTNFASSINVEQLQFRKIGDTRKVRVQQTRQNYLSQ